MKSDAIKHGAGNAPHRALYHALGMTKEELDRPLIGIVSSYNEIVPGHMNIDKITEAVRLGVAMAGGTPIVFPAIAVCDGIAMGHEGMKYSLITRDLIADSTEAMVRAHGFDALVMIPNCDKNVPGLLMAAARLNIPTIFVSGGPMMAGHVDGHKTSLSSMFEAVGAYSAGKCTEKKLTEYECKSCPTCGSCSGMYTANSMNCLTEVLGMGLRGNGTIPAVYSARIELAKHALGGERLSRILSAVNRGFSVLPDAEITIEGNPADDYGAIAPIIAKAGCNRVSLGVQSANNNELSVLGRRHKNDDVLSAVATLRDNGITNISVDLMLGLPESNKESLKNSIDFVLSLDVPHISAYILKLESGTPLHKTAPPLPNDDEVSEQYLMLCQMLKQNGYEHYEISNFAKKDMHSQHNSAYWECKEYLGLGPAAHSFLFGKRFYYPADLKEYIKSPTPVPDGEGGGKYEYIMLGLRLKKGISAAEFKDKTGSDLPEGIMKKAIQLKNSGICDINGDRISLSDEGMLVSNAVINYFTEEL